MHFSQIISTLVGFRFTVQYSRSRGTSNALVTWPSSSSSIITAPPQSVQLLFLSMAGCVTWKSFPSRSKQLGLVIRTQCDHSNIQGHPRLASKTERENKKQWPFMLVKEQTDGKIFIRESVLEADSLRGLRSSWHTQRHVRALSWKRQERCDGSTLSTDIWMSIHMAEAQNYTACCLVLQRWVKNPKKHAFLL